MLFAHFFQIHFDSSDMYDDEQLQGSLSGIEKQSGVDDGFYAATDSFSQG